MQGNCGKFNENITSSADKATFGDYAALKKTHLFLTVDLNREF